MLSTKRSNRIVQKQRIGYHMHLRTQFSAQLLSEADLQCLFDTAVRIWRQVPFRVQGTDEFMDYLSAFGCELSGELVRFPRPVIDRTLDRIREQKARSRNANEGWPAPDPGNRIEMYTHGQAILTCDLGTNTLRPATADDLVTWCHVVDALGIETRSHPTFLPTDVPNSAVDFNAYALIMLNSKKRHRVSLFNAKMLPYFIDASVIAEGSLEAVKANPVFGVKMWVNSPFMITRENVEVAMDARRLLGQPIQPSTMPNAGAATPVTIAGAVAQNTAELLGLNAITLAVDGRLHGSSVGPVVVDMSAASARAFGPDVQLLRLATDEMRRFMFGGRADYSALTPGGQVVNAQTVMEKAIQYSLMVMTGQRSLGVGTIGTADVGSLVQLMIDVELCGFFQSMLREVTIDEAHIGEETIIETARRGAYFLDTDHTAEFFREELWLPDLFDYRIAGAWQEDPSDMIDQARDKVYGLTGTVENQCPLSADQRAEIRRLLDAANRDAGDARTR